VCKRHGKESPSRGKGIQDQEKEEEQLEEIDHKKTCTHVMMRSMQLKIGMKECVGHGIKFKRRRYEGCTTRARPRRSVPLAKWMKRCSKKGHTNHIVNSVQEIRKDKTCITEG